MLKATATFLLDSPPLDEIPDDIASVVERFRYKALSKKEALRVLIKDYKNKLEKIHEQNEIINSELRNC